MRDPESNEAVMHVHILRQRGTQKALDSKVPKKETLA